MSRWGVALSQVDYTPRQLDYLYRIAVREYNDEQAAIERAAKNR